MTDYSKMEPQNYITNLQAKLYSAGLKIDRVKNQLQDSQKAVRVLEAKIDRLNRKYIASLNDHQDTLAKLLELQDKHLNLLDRVQQLMKEQS